MKLIALAAVALMAASATTTAHARTETGTVATTLYQSGDWRTYYHPKTTDGSPACGMSAMLHDERGHLVNLDVKKFDEGLWFILAKDGWHFPANTIEAGVDVPLALGFDNDPKELVVAPGVGYMHKSIPFVKFEVRETQQGQTDAFLEMFAHANSMWIKFKAGNERPWAVSMLGSRGAVDAFQDCEARLRGESQPYSSAPSQPFEKRVKTTREPGHEI